MSKKVWFAVVVVCAGVLLFAGNAAAQFGPQVKVSDAIEGGVGGVSAARCGGTVVVGFADAEPKTPNSFAGAAISRSGGLTFTDRGVLPVQPPAFDGPNVLGRDFDDSIGSSSPSVACANSNVFYYASAYQNSGDLCSNEFGGCTAISVSKSTNGGISWGLPVIAAIQGFDTFDYVSPSMAVDPSDPMRLYVAFISWDFSTFFAPCETPGAYEVAVASSTDGGKTWGQTLRVDHACDGPAEDPTSSGTMFSPNITVAADGSVYLTDAFVGQSGNPNAIHFLRSTDHGNSFSAPIVVSTQATNNATPQLTVDRTSGSSRGTIYLTWSGSQTGTYTDTLVSESLDGGASFSFPQPISGAPSGGRFQAHPVIAVDNDGQVQACFYETPTNTPDNNSVYSYNCAISVNQGAGWQITQLSAAAPAGFDSVSGDFLLKNDGFFTAFELQSSGQRHVVGAGSDNP